MAANGVSDASSDPATALAGLLHERAEVFANPALDAGNVSGSGEASTSRSVHRETLRATKYLFDNALKAEATTLPALAELLADIRGTAAEHEEIQTRSMSKGTKNLRRNINGSQAAKGKGKARAANPLFQPTPLQELFVGTPSTGISGQGSVDDEIRLQMIWEQLGLKVGKALAIYKEIVMDGESLEDEDEIAEQVSDDNDDEAGIDLEDEDIDDDAADMLLDEDGELVLDSDDMEADDLSEDDEEDGDSLDFEDDEDDGRPNPEPYFAKLRDDSSPPPSSSSSTSISKQKKKADKQKTAASHVQAAEASTPVDSGFFSLADFHSQMREGEDEMKRYMQIGKSKSAADVQDRLDSLEMNGGVDDDEDEDIDYFAPADGGGESDEEEAIAEEEEEEEEDGLKPEDMRYSDFWNAPRAIYGQVPGVKGPKNGVAAADKVKKGKVAQDDSSASNDKSQESTEPAKKRRVSFHDNVKVLEIESNNKQSAVAALVKQFGMKEAMRRLSAGEEEDDAFQGLEEEDDDDDEDDDLQDGNSDEEEEEEAEDDESEEGDSEGEASSVGSDIDAAIARRTQRDLLDDSEDDEDEDSSTASGKKKKGKSAMSRHEQRMAALSEQIAELEAENVAEKSWTLKGESTSRARPLNSLLEEDLEFDQVAKVVPVVTEESNLTLEDRIKKRILDEQYDDVIRRRVNEPAAYIPSKLLELKDTPSDKSLAEIYADEFAAERARATGEAAATPEVDSKLKKEHDLISSIFDEVCNKLDALSNARFTPKAAQTAITTVSNLPSIAMESSLPTAASSSTLLAPEEVYAPSQNGSLVSKSEMTPSQKKAARTKARKARMQTLKSIHKYGGSTSSVKKQKERAMDSLIGKRGVTVVGKGKAAKSALTGKDRKGRANGLSEAGTSGSGITGSILKL